MNDITEFKIGEVDFINFFNEVIIPVKNISRINLTESKKTYVVFYKEITIKDDLIGYILPSNIKDKMTDWLKGK